MIPGFVSAAPRKFSIWGEGGWLAKKEKSMGKPKVRKYSVKWAQVGKPRGREEQEAGGVG